MLDRRWFQRLFFIVVLSLQVLIIVYWGFQKQGFYIDELWSFGLANSYFFPHLFVDGSLDNTYIYPDQLWSYLVVDEGESFTYDSVYYNLSNDAHPPGFFFILHSVCSLFPGEFSKWMGIVPNIVLFIVGQIALLHLSTKLIKGAWVRFVPTILWGFSTAAISYTLFIRSCLLSSVAVLLLLISHRRLLVDNDGGLKTCLGLFLFSFFCYMTHYYLFILAFAIACATVLLLLIRKSWKLFLKYCISMLAGLLLTALVFPSAYVHLFFDEYSSNARHGIFLHPLSERVADFVQDALPDLFHGSSLYAILIIFLLFACIVIGITWRSKGSGPGDRRFGYCLMMFAANIAFILCAIYASPWQSTRYIVFSYPVCILMGCWLVVEGLKRFADIRNSRTISKVCILLLGFIVVVDLACLPSTIKFLYPEDESNRQALAKDAGCQVLYLSEVPGTMVGRILELQQVSVIWPDSTDPQSVSNAISHINENNDVLLVYLDSSALDSRKNILQSIVDQSSYDSFRHLAGYTIMNEKTASGDDGTWGGDFYEVYKY